VFEKEEIEPLQTELQDINSLGQALIQGAAKASSTQGLEDELDSINAKWNTLNKKVGTSTVPDSSPTSDKQLPLSCVLSKLTIINAVFIVQMMTSSTSPSL
jgi:hypothetical protein